jgi:hypothetical protein
VSLRGDLDAMLQRIRSERDIRLHIIKCPNCGHVEVGFLESDCAIALLDDALTFHNRVVEALPTTSAREAKWLNGGVVELLLLSYI